MSNDNPYASPTTMGGPTGGGEFGDDIPADQLVPASQNRRFINFLVDRAMGFVIVPATGFCLGLAMALLGLGDWLMNIHPAADFLLSTFILLGFYFAQEVLFRRTIGKLLTGTIVVNLDGGRPTAGQILGRTLARAIPFEPFSALTGKFPNPWHDRLSKTRVVRIGG